MNINLSLCAGAILLITLPVFGQVPFGFDEPDSTTPSFSRGSTAGDSWTNTEGHRARLKGVQPAANVLAELKVEWQPVTIDELGETVTIRGQLMQSQNTEGNSSPIDWQQGVTVAVRCQPSSDHNAFEPISLLYTQSVTETCITDDSGAFEVKIKLNGLTRDKEKEQDFRCALALAIHSNREQFGPVVDWSSDDTPLKLSYGDLAFPPNPSIDPIIEAIRVACENDFDPNAMILAVNALQPLGKEAALQRMEAFIVSREQSDLYFMESDGLFWILRLLFEPIELDRRIPVPRAFARAVDPSVESNWPLNPIAVVADIPFRFIGGAMGFSGIAEEPRSHIRFVRRYCVIRDTPLHPSRDPILAAQQLIESPLVSKMPERDRETAIGDIRDQAMLLLPDERIAVLPKLADEEAWLAILKSSQSSPLVWDPEKGFQEADQ